MAVISVLNRLAKDLKAVQPQYLHIDKTFYKLNSNVGTYHLRYNDDAKMNRFAADFLRQPPLLSEARQASCHLQHQEKFFSNIPTKDPDNTKMNPDNTKMNPYASKLLKQPPLLCGTRQASCYLQHQVKFFSSISTKDLDDTKVNCCALKLLRQPPLLGEARLASCCLKHHVKFFSNIPSKDPDGDFRKLWYVQRAVQVALLGIVPAAFAFPSEIMDDVLAASFVIHHHWGFEHILSDYASPQNIGAFMATTFHFLNYILSAIVLGGLVVFNNNDIGIGELVLSVWRFGKTDEHGKNGKPPGGDTSAK